ncbi:MAG: type VI secretion system accessory protein TagJ [Candidatus Binataceae bacterium]
MNARQLLESGQLTAAIEQLNLEVRAHPLETRLRTSLFEVLCFAGDFARAERQLDALAQQNTELEIGVQVYRAALMAERSRERLFDSGIAPGFITEPPAFVRLQLEALNRLREQRPAEARASLEEAADAQDDLPGRLNGENFADFSDADPLLGPVLELLIHDRYIWLPLVQLRRLILSAPKRMRDLLWLPVTFETVAGTSGGAFLPGLYYGSNRHPDDQVKLGRVTLWEDLGDRLSRGIGRRMFFMDDSERSVLDIHELEFGNHSS